MILNRLFFQKDYLGDFGNQVFSFAIDFLADRSCAFLLQLDE